ncbi:L-ascorbate oxidase-like [Oryza glaberrima]|uniref:L-ascorbate oxidase n=1 Tax=Oryza glaberrima TaxID=4538 RepID=I1Q353_ORYGL|nr:L-ascorbate oxidase-like [Oryza glaberrima]
MAAAVQLLVAAAAAAMAAATVEVTWDVEYILWAPDCQQRVMIGINGRFPGPNITARAGDVISVTMNNKMHTEGVVIHWHGIRQFGTPWADGTASISQCAVNPGETFIYKFVADKPGTYFYHGHFGMQRAAGLYGSLIVLDSPEQPEPFRHQYDDGGELPMMLLSDWWHQNVYAQAAGLDGKDRHFEWIGEPQTILINGRGQFECTLGPTRKSFERLLNENVETCVDDQKMCSDQEKCLRRSECGPYCPRSQCAPVVFNVQQGKTYRLRIASTTSLSLLNVKIQGHKMTVVEADGNHVEPFVVDDIDIYSGESYSVLLKADQKPASYWISVGVRGRHPKTVPALAILSYGNGNAAAPSLQLPAGEPPVTPAWNDTQRSKAFTYSIRARKDTNQPPPAAADRQIFLLNTQNLMDGRYRWSINNVSLTLPATPYLGAFHHGLQDSAFDASGEPPAAFPEDYDVMRPPANNATTASDRVFRLRHGAVVDVVLQNANMLREEVSETHPWHLHGHDFWVLGYGDGRYDPAAHAAGLNAADPPLRNTAVVFPHGWTALRFVANNTGAWAFHCHIEPHLHMGMGVVFIEGEDRMHELDVPKDAMACGLVARTAATPLTPATPLPPSPAPAP